ncbi:PilZ domain-containing protein [Sphingomonas flavalba]|uniref:PilZ domain-containing protein n=1 Tax=Sphingomonas flavalba TaxID=2559804 RepID=UPI001EEFD8F5|nr:PilZ domain-containing protein [Sphingomonas flavalba]
MTETDAPSPDGTSPPESPDAVPDSGEGEQRGDMRDSLYLLARVRGLPTGGEILARVRNLSAKGMMIEFDRAVAVDQRLVVEVRGIGAVGARVAWARDERVGLELDRAIDPLAARLPVSGRRDLGRKPLRGD